jgi:DNA-binding MarR family transcriptional regulator
MQVLRQFRLIYGSVKQHFRDVEKQCGISGSQVWLLREVATTPGTGVSRLAERLSIHQSTCSLLVEKLVGAGLVSKTRSTDDQRRVGLMLTLTGTQLLKSAPGPAEGILPDALKQLPDDSLQTLNATLSQLISNLTMLNENDAEKPLAEL